MEQIEERTGEKAEFAGDGSWDGTSTYQLPAKDILDFGVAIPESDLDEEKFGGKFYAHNPEFNFSAMRKLNPHYAETWADRPKHDSNIRFRTESGVYRADGFVDHWTCQVRLLDIRAD